MKSLRKGSVDDVLGVCLGGGTILEDEEEAEEEVKGDCWVEDPVEVKRESILCSSGVCIVVVTDDVLVWWVVCVLVCVLSKKREKETGAGRAKKPVLCTRPKGR